jgi:hypothetical protein
VELKIRRPSTPSLDDINEYIPSGYISSFIPSKVVRTIYLMPKVNPNKDWEGGSNWEYSLDYENVTYRGTGTGGSYNGVTNAPIYLNYTNHANYSQRRNLGAGYPSMNPYGYSGI